MMKPWWYRALKRLGWRWHDDPELRDDETPDAGLIVFAVLVACVFGTIAVVVKACAEVP
jgi:hypothetical protein